MKRGNDMKLILRFKDNYLEKIVFNLVIKHNNPLLVH